MNKQIKSFTYALNGIRKAFGSEINLKIHFIFVFAVVVCGIVFKIDTFEWIACLICFALVIAAEMLNTAIEGIVNLVSPEKNEAAGRIKDISAGAVLICAVFSAIVGLIIFVPKAYMLIF